MSELEGTVEIRHPIAREEAEVGPILQGLPREIIRVWQKMWTLRELIKEFEPMLGAG